MKDKKERLLEEQEAPLKNTDHAFVQVSKDGSPHLPDRAKEQDPKEKQTESSPRTTRP